MLHTASLPAGRQGVPERLTQKCAKRVRPKNTPMCLVIIVPQNAQKNKALPSSVKKPIRNKQQATYEPLTKQNYLPQILTMPLAFTPPFLPRCKLFVILFPHCPSKYFLQRIRNKFEERHYTSSRVHSMRIARHFVSIAVTNRNSVQVCR